MIMPGDLTIDGIVETAKAIKEMLDFATYEVDGKVIQKPFYTLTSAGNKVNCLIYLDEDDTGVIENFKIHTKNGKIFYETSEFIEKDDTEGFVAGFTLVVDSRSIDMDESLWEQLKGTLNEQDNYTR